MSGQVESDESLDDEPGSPGGAGSARRVALGYMHGARSGLLTLLSRFVYPDPVPVPTQVFINALGLLEFNEKASRQALMRARDAGWLESRKSGRRSFWVLSPQGHELMDEGSARLRALQQPNPVWDGRVLLVNVSVPETDRKTRHVVRTRMHWLSFTTLSNGLWVSTSLKAESDARELCAELGLDAYSFIGTAGAIGDLVEVVRDAWNLSELAAEYQSFIDEFKELRPVTPEEYFISLVRLVHRWRRFPFIDPNLPDELLPAPWIGKQAATLARSLSRLWNPAANDFWKQMIREVADSA
jgi:phenylacetic acid degradation operon negative regulatory protein